MSVMDAENLPGFVYIPFEPLTPHWFFDFLDGHDQAVLAFFIFLQTWAQA